MAFSAGYTNGVCLSGFVDSNEIITKQSVAGVTGVYTNSAIFFSSEQIDQAAFQVGIIFSVMVGGFIAALMNPYPVAFEISPRFAPTFLIASLFMILGAIEQIHNERREFYFTGKSIHIMNTCTYSSSFCNSFLFAPTSHSNRQWHPKWYKLHVFGESITNFSFDRHNYRHWPLLRNGNSRQQDK